MECVICANTLVPQGEEKLSRKRSLAELRIKGREDKCMEWRRNFRCFVKLLGIGQDEVGILLGKAGGSLRLPACEACNAALKEVGHLERTMEQLKAKQKALVEQLEGSLLFSGGITDSSGELRKQLIACFMRLHRPTTKQEKPRELSAPNRSSAVVEFVEEAELALKVKVEPEYGVNMGSEEEDLELASPVEEAGWSEEDDEIGDPPSKRQRRTRHLDSSDGDCLLKAEDSLFLKEEHFKANLGGNGDASDDGKKDAEACTSRVSRKTGRTSPPDKKNALKGNGNGESQIFNTFCLLSNNLILYKYTVFRITEGQGVYCEEPGCDHQVAPIFTTLNQYDSLEKARQHVETVHYAQKDYQSKRRFCPLCSEVQSTLNFRKHLLKGNHGTARCLCPSCGTTREHPQNLKSHMWSHKSAEEQAAEGQVPHKILARQRRQERDLLREYKCDDCGEILIGRNSFRSHKGKHLRENSKIQPFVCEECGQHLLNRACLKQHMINYHRPELRKAFFCPICNQKYASKPGLDVHLAVHRNERDVVCEQCGKEFLHRKNLLIHVKNIHGSVTEEKCQLCGMQFKNPKYLIRHLKNVHKMPMSEPKRQGRKVVPLIGPKIAYPCPVCEKVFELRSRMTKHLNQTHPEAYVTTE